jgi:hypothetical protein
VGNALTHGEGSQTTPTATSSWSPTRPYPVGSVLGNGLFTGEDYAACD